MTCIGVRVSVGGAIVLLTACAGKLEVGEDSQRKAVTEGESTSTSGGAGGTTPAAVVTGSGTSSGTTADGTSGEQGGSWADEITPVPAVSGSSEGCPMGPQAPEGECETEGLSCLYRYADGSSLAYQQCYCVRASQGRQVWECWQSSAGDERCPIAPPAHASDCYGYFGLSCVYPPAFECTCHSSNGTWSCPTQNSEAPPDPPETIDPERLVAELTDEERETWCEWYSSLHHPGGPGYPPVADLPVEGGNAVGGGCAYSQECGAAVPFVSVAQCVANLSLSTCESPVSLLTGCASDMSDARCGPFDYDCLDYLETPNCTGTIILRADTASGGGRCNLRVE